ncbi:hypothetical protein [Halalkalibacter alkaliphilus]|uniref:Uncharacterized protein n=1 Tax=Halalkalibacter alkaliphilus TaxID=2917993 RepID=A0A9X2CTV8_9BACI|nr:hypothetical protein [Halalkalibacter alkaliphilus]MCL7748158.1 hypothetical protein [Halalkalibacter alkaliphilus]
MTYHPERMKVLLTYDRFLKSTYEEVLQFTKDEESALHYLFTSYITTEPIFKNAYEQLT